MFGTVAGPFEACNFSFLLGGKKIDSKRETTSKLNQNMLSQNTHKLPFPVSKKIPQGHWISALNPSLWKQPP